MSEDIKTFEQLQTPFGHLSFEEETGESFEPKVAYQMVGVNDGTGYATIEQVEHTDKRKNNEE
jgi:hypothetical protein